MLSVHWLIAGMVGHMPLLQMHPLWGKLSPAVYMFVVIKEHEKR